MERYKLLRKDLSKKEKAREYLREAQELDKLGEVSQNVVLAWQNLG